MNNRRNFFTRLASFGAAFFAGRQATAQRPATPPDHSGHVHVDPPNKTGQGAVRGRTQPAGVPPAPAPPKRAAFNIPVHTPDLPKLPHKMVDGWKEFHLIAEPVR